MKSLIKNLLVFAALAVAISSFNGCNRDTSPGSANANTVALTNAAPAAKPVDASTYPPLASGIANADMEAVDGSTSKIADRKGKVVLVNLWAVWCGPCRAEMPHLVELQDKYRDQGFQVLGLNVGKDQDSNEGESLQAIKEFGEKMKLNYELARIDRATANQYYKLAQMDGIPISFLIDRDGRLRAVLRGGGSQVMNDMDASIARAMAQ